MFVEIELSMEDKMLFGFCIGYKKIDSVISTFYTTSKEECISWIKEINSICGYFHYQKHKVKRYL
jgi:hypothetical protein